MLREDFSGLVEKGLSVVMAVNARSHTMSHHGHQRCFTSISADLNTVPKGICVLTGVLAVKGTSRSS